MRLEFSERLKKAIAVTGSQRSREANRALANRPCVFDVQWRFQGEILVPKNADPLMAHKPMLKQRVEEDSLEKHTFSINIHFIKYSYDKQNNFAAIQRRFIWSLSKSWKKAKSSRVLKV